MDLFHSVKQIERIPLAVVDVPLAEEMIKKYGIGISHALTCAVAIRIGAHEIHSLYKDMHDPSLVEYLKSIHGIQICRPQQVVETTYQPELERAYRDAFKKLKNHHIDVLQQLTEAHC